MYCLTFVTVHLLRDADNCDQAEYYKKGEYCKYDHVGAYPQTC